MILVRVCYTCFVIHQLFELQDGGDSLYYLYQMSNHVSFEKLVFNESIP